MKDACLGGANLSEATLERTGLEKANLKGANLSLAKLWDASLVEADLTGTDLKDAVRPKAAKFCKTKTPYGIDNTGVRKNNHPHPYLSSSRETGLVKTIADVLYIFLPNIVLQRQQITDVEVGILAYCHFYTLFRLCPAFTTGMTCSQKCDL